MGESWKEILLLCAKYGALLRRAPSARAQHLCVELLFEASNVFASLHVCCVVLCFRLLAMGCKVISDHAQMLNGLHNLWVVLPLWIYIETFWSAWLVTSARLSFFISSYSLWSNCRYFCFFYMFTWSSHPHFTDHLFLNVYRQWKVHAYLAISIGILFTLSSSQ